jgi:hypothetical protein
MPSVKWSARTEECTLVTNKRAARWKVFAGAIKKRPGIPFLRPNYSCHYTCGFQRQARAKSRCAIDVFHERRGLSAYVEAVSNLVRLRLRFCNP